MFYDKIIVCDGSAGSVMANCLSAPEATGLLKRAPRFFSLLTPGPDGLVEMIDPCRAPFESDFSKLIKDRRGRRIDMAAEGRQEQADNRTLRLFDRKYV